MLQGDHIGVARAPHAVQEKVFLSSITSQAAPLADVFRVARAAPGFVGHQYRAGTRRRQKDEIWFERAARRAPSTEQKG
jgi:hypothetical protein